MAKKKPKAKEELSEREMSEGALRSCLSLKLRIEDKIKETIKNNEGTYEFEGKRYIISEGLIEVRNWQEQIDEILEFMITKKKTKK